ncbi:BTAD domain-containing putative transcriptional regulator [Amycolatopsis samaneae]|uniref:BTAD domain-containing putative transcriptional regulator n=1 Tax=Amycolatopsis samaneae TaxID=664691 RepID=A0ABW5GPI9_9PSEU
MSGDGRTPDLGGLVRRHRLAAGWRQEDLAARAGVSVRTVRNIERNRVAAPRDGSLRRLLASLGIPRPAGLVGPDAPAVDEDAAGPGPVAPRIDVLGPLSVHRGEDVVDLRSRRLRELLGLLAIRTPHAVGRGEIVDWLWEERPPRTCLALVNTYIARLRDLLEPDRAPDRPARVVVRTATGYRLEPGGLDLTTFDDLLDRGLRAGATGDHRAAWRLLTRALDRWRGPLLADVGTRLVRHPAAVAIAARRMSALIAYADAALASGAHDHAVARLRPHVEEEPLHEGLHARLMLALAGTGQQAAAVDLFTGLRARLADNLGISPGPVVHDAYLRVLRQETGPIGRGPAPAAAVTVPAQLPPAVPAFVGRAAHLRGLDELLSTVDDRAGPVIGVLSGWAGVGKTALAVWWAHGVRDRFPDGQVYVDLRGFDPAGVPAVPADVVHDFLAALGVAPDAIPAGLAARTALYRTLAADRRLLVVLDNAEDEAQVRPLLPGSAGCFVLVTSRRRLTGLLAGGASQVTVDLLPEDEAAALLALRVGADRVAREPAAARRIVDRCAGLPLALTIVAARAIANPRFGLADLAAELGGLQRGLDSLDGGDADVRAVLSWSYDKLDPGQARMFRLLALVPGVDVTAPAAASLAAVARARAHAALTELARAHLIGEHSPGRYSMHDLLRGYGRELTRTSDSVEDRAAAVRRLVRHYVRAASLAAASVTPSWRTPARTEAGEDGPLTAEQAVRWYDAERHTLLAVARHAPGAGLDAEVCDLVHALTELFDRRGHWHDWAAVTELAHTSAERLGDVVRKARLHRSHARAEVWLENFGRARGHLRHALRDYAAVADETELAHTYRTLSWCLGREGDRGEAVTHARIAVRLHDIAGDRAGQGLSLNTLGWQHAHLGEYEPALRYCHQAATILEDAGDANGAGYAHDSLGFIQHRLGGYAAATEHYRRAVTLLRQTGDLYQEAETLLGLGDTRAAADDHAGATWAWLRAVELFDRLGHPYAAQARTRLTAGAPPEPRGDGA